MHVQVAATILALFGASALTAQARAARVDPGSRVRIVATTFYPALVGRVLRMTPDSLYVRTTTRVEPDVAVPFGSISHLAVSVGVSRRRGAARWAISGFLLGALTGVTLGSSDMPGAPSDGRSGAAVLRLGAYGAATGAILGALLGSVHGGERWQAVPVPIRQLRR